MTTDITVRRTTAQSERRSWLIPQNESIGFGYTPSISLLPSAFTAATHYPNGFIPSGTIVGRITASGLYGPFDAAATDGRQDAANARILFSSITVNFLDLTKPLGGAGLAAFAVVSRGKLPFATGAGAITAAVETALKTIHFEA